MTADHPTREERLTSLVLDALHDAHHKPGSITMLDLAAHVAAALVAADPAPKAVEWSRLAADDGWEDVDEAALRGRAVEAVAWGLLDATMDVADREPSAEAYRAATRTATRLLAAVPTPTQSDAARDGEALAIVKRACDIECQSPGKHTQCSSHEPYRVLREALLREALLRDALAARAAQPVPAPEVSRGVAEAVEIADMLDGTRVTANTWQSAARRLADENRHLRDAAWEREHYAVVRSHGCDSPAPECACGSPLTPHLRPERIAPDALPTECDAAVESVLAAEVRNGLDPVTRRRLSTALAPLLAANVRDSAKEAWDEGYKAGGEDQTNAYWGCNFVATANPYALPAEGESS